MHGAEFVELVEGDIARVPDSLFPPTVATCLVDVDLSEPTYAALSRIYPRLAPGGVILVDDCPPESSWKARLGYQRFVSEVGLLERYEFGMGIVQRENKSA